MDEPREPLPPWALVILGAAVAALFCWMGFAALRAHSGPAAISGYRCPEYDRWLHDWRRHDFEMPNNAGQSKRKQRRTESLWTNW